MAGKKAREKREFVEDFAMFIEGLGVPPMAGRVWAWLLVCYPPHQTAAELAEAVGASLGAISAATRLLMQFGVIERVGLPGERRRFYRIRPGGFTELLRIKMQATTESRRMAERGLALLKGEPAEVRGRLEEYRDFYAFFERELPALIDRWKQEGKGQKS